MIVGNSLVKYLRREELSSEKNNVKVITHPGSTTKHMVDYIKPVAWRKPERELANGINTIKKKKKKKKTSKSSS